MVCPAADRRCFSVWALAGVAEDLVDGDVVGVLVEAVHAQMLGPMARRLRGPRTVRAG
jgi:hypothetical protein